MTTRRKPTASKAKRFAEIEKISILGITERMGPLGLHMYAEAYLNAARSLPFPQVPFEPVRPFLACHSIELGLKAFLCLQGSTMLEAADSFGHNLETLLQKADEKHLSASVTLTPEQRAKIRRGSRYYVGKLFEYPAVGEALSGYPDMPDVNILLEGAGRLVDSLRQKCKEAR